MLEFNDLLQKSAIDPATVMLMRHRPTERELREILLTLADERPEVFNTYQSSHPPRVETSLQRASYLASFIGHQPGRAVFVGVYKVAGSRQVTQKQFLQLPHMDTLRALGTRGPPAGGSCAWFTLNRSKHLAAYQGRLVINWSGIERSWWRWAERNTMTVHSIADESLLVRAMPDWRAMSLSWLSLQTLPSSWKQALAQWRGIYYIFDQVAKSGYVGAAYGAENLLGRWKNYASTGHGGNRLLRARDPANFTFSILERVSPDMSSEDVQALEASWKRRLHTISPNGLNDN